MRKSIACFLLTGLALISVFAFPRSGLAADELIVVYNWQGIGGNCIFVKDNPVTLKEGTTPGYTNIYLDSDLNTPLTPPGFPAATAAGYDLSGFRICGAYDGGLPSVSTSITMLGGSVRGITGGGGGGSRGDIRIQVKGGRTTSVSTTTIWGASSDYFDGKCIVEISGGYVDGNVHCGGWSLSNAKDDCQVVITGGTIRGNILISYAVPTANRSIVITGGTIRGNITSYDAVLTAPTNGSVPVYKTALTLPNIQVETNVQNRLSLTGRAAGHAKKDLVTNASGDLFLWLPEGTSYANDGTNYFQADVLAANDPNNAFYAVAKPVVPVAPVAAEAIPQTGDHNLPFFWVGLIALAVVGAVVIRRKRKAVS